MKHSRSVQTVTKDKGGNKLQTFKAVRIIKLYTEHTCNTYPLITTHLRFVDTVDMNVSMISSDHSQKFNATATTVNQLAKKMNEQATNLPSPEELHVYSLNTVLLRR